MPQQELQRDRKRFSKSITVSPTFSSRVSRSQSQTEIFRSLSWGRKHVISNILTKTNGNLKNSEIETRVDFCAQVLPSKHWVGCVGQIMVSVIDRLSSQNYLNVWITLKEKQNNVLQIRPVYIHCTYMFILSSRSDFPYHAIIVFGLQIDGSDHIYPDQTLLRSTIWQLPELTGWWGNAWVIGQRVHLKGTLHVQKPHKTIVSTTLHSFLSLIKSAQTTLSSPTTVGSIIIPIFILASQQFESVTEISQTFEL